jgi:hypothetical protein
MDEHKVNAFYEEHKMKIGKDYRLEVLKMSKEDIYDYLDWKHQDNVHEWRKALFASEYKVKQLEKKIARRIEIDNSTKQIKPLI